MLRHLILFFACLMPALCYGVCSEYYLSLDFGGRVGDGPLINDYLVKQKVPHMVFMVGNNLDSAAAKFLCNKIKTDPEYRKYIRLGNHSLSHKGFTAKDDRAYITKEIMGNEAKIIKLCGAENFVRVFRYPKGQVHPIAEEVLKANNYSPQYAPYTIGTAKSDFGVGWTSDTKDWLEEGAASLWAQETYFKRYRRLMPVSESSAKDLERYVKSRKASKDLSAAFAKGSRPRVFNPKKHRLVEEWHGPSSKKIIEKILNDEGVDGKCVPLAHFGGFKTLEALKLAVPELKRRGAQFKHFGDDLSYALELFPENIQPEKEIAGAHCSGPSALEHELSYTVVKGDTLYSLSKRFGISLEELKAINALKSDSLELGQRLYLSAPESVHYVEAGETLFSISRSYGVPVKELKSSNGLSSNEIDIGQKLLIDRKLAP